MRREAAPGDLGAHLQHTEREEQCAYREGDEHDRERGGRRTGERFEEAGESEESGVRRVEHGGEGRDGREVQGFVLRSEGRGTWPRLSGTET